MNFVNLSGFASLVRRWSDKSQLLGKTKIMVLKHAPLGEINLMGCKQHSLVPINRQSSQATLISRYRRKQRYHTALPSQTTFAARTFRSLAVGKKPKGKAI